MITIEAQEFLLKILKSKAPDSAIGWLANRYSENKLTIEQVSELRTHFNNKQNKFFDSILKEVNEGFVIREEERKKAEKERQAFMNLPNYERNHFPKDMDSEKGWCAKGYLIEGKPIARSGEIPLYKQPVSYWRSVPEEFQSRTYWKRKGREVIGNHQVWRNSYGKLPAYGLWSIDHTRPRTWRCKDISSEEKGFLRAIERDKLAYLVYSDWLEENGRVIEVNYYRHVQEKVVEHYKKQ